MRLLPILLLALVAAIGEASRAPAQPDELTGQLAELARWTNRGPSHDPEALGECSRLLGALDRGWGPHDPRGEEIRWALLDFLGRCLRVADAVALQPRPERSASALITGGEEDLRRRATAILRRRLPEGRRALTLGVLMGRVEGEPHPLERRLAACEVLREDTSGETTLALLSCTRPAPPAEEVPRALLDAAVAALAGRDDPGVHQRLVALLRAAEAGELRIWMEGALDHFGRVELAADRRAVAEVQAYVHGALADESWRRASRGVAVARCLPHEQAFPELIEALALWIERGSAGERQVMRVQGEVLAELERRSGRRLGARPERWRSLWGAHQRGEARLRGEGRVPDEMTTSGFFGLRPWTDRVCFVLDRSGSMSTDFGGQRGHQRLEEAADQMARLLVQLGPRTRFDVVVFSDGARTWRGKLQDASEDAVREAANWVRRVGAQGGTRLRSGVLAAMHVDRAGQPDLARLEADTIIVLCDGETAEGAAWVEPFLRDANDEARIVFHAVQIGGGSDGTLERLCAGTGGEFLRVDG